MKMIINIALRECYNNLVSARFILGFVLCLLLIPFSIVVGIQEYRSRVAVYEVEQAQARESTQVHVWSEYRPVVVKPPEPLSILSKGISGTAGNQVTTRLGEVPMLAAGQTSVRQNPFLNSIFTLDFVTVLAILMSLLALVFSYDVCTGEKESGTLKLLLKLKSTTLPNVERAYCRSACRCVPDSGGLGTDAVSCRDQYRVFQCIRGAWHICLLAEPILGDQHGDLSLRVGRLHVYRSQWRGICRPEFRHRPVEGKPSICA